MGNIYSACSSSCLTSVHPHACGEHLLSLFIFLFNFGSSPRLWGTSFNSSNCIYICRFIPTPVGNIYLAPGYCYHQPVHPHACGEHTWLHNSRECFCGSSPRLWGTFDSTIGGFFNIRFIPTPVGNIEAMQHRSYGKTVHPHACGEHYKIK